MRTLLFALFLLWAPLGLAGEGRDAGYDWAEDNDISDPDDCEGNSDSFIEGCQERAEESDEYRIENEECEDEDEDDECDW